MFYSGDVFGTGYTITIASFLLRVGSSDGSFGVLYGLGNVSSVISLNVGVLERLCSDQELKLLLLILPAVGIC